MAHVVLLYHIIWRTKKSEKTINPIFERELYAYINGFCTEKQCRLFRIGGMEDHIHLLVSIRPDISICEFMQVLKSQTSHWIKEKPSKYPLFKGWGSGYAAFSYSDRDKEIIRQYIMNQKEHHKKINFQEEYKNFLIEWGIDPTTDLFLKD